MTVPEHLGGVVGTFRKLHTGGHEDRFGLVGHGLIRRQLDQIGKRTKIEMGHGIYTVPGTMFTDDNRPSGSMWISPSLTICRMVSDAYALHRVVSLPIRDAVAAARDDTWHLGMVSSRDRMVGLYLLGLRNHDAQDFAGAAASVCSVSLGSSGLVVGPVDAVKERKTSTAVPILAAWSWSRFCSVSRCSTVFAMSTMLFLQGAYDDLPHGFKHGG